MAIDFNGGDTVEWGDNIKPSPNFTCQCWGRLDASSNFGWMFGKDHATPRASPFVSYGLGTNGSNVVWQANMAVSGSHRFDSIASISIGDKAHLSEKFIDASDVMESFLNGGGKQSLVVIGAVDYSNGNLVAGGNPDQGDSWNGPIAECTVWSDDLTDTHIAALGRGAPSFIMRNDILVFYVPLWGHESTEDDYKARLTGTITGDPTKADWHGNCEQLENFI